MVTIILDNWIRVSGLPKDLFEQVRVRLTYLNPDYEKAKKFSQSGRVRFIPRTRHSYDYVDNNMCLPKGYLMEFLVLLNEEGIPYQIYDRRNNKKELELPPQVKMRSYQEQMIEEALLYPGPAFMMQAPPGTGKTACGLDLARRLGRKTLWVAHTGPLVKQAKDAAEWILGVPKKEIGIIGQGKFDIGKFITIATIQTLHKKLDRLNDYRYEFGTVVMDEIHHKAAKTWHIGGHIFASASTVGLTATPYRNDGLTLMLEDCAGPVVTYASQKLLKEEGVLIVPTVLVCYTNLQFSGETFNEILDKLINDYRRNQIIFDVITTIYNQNENNVILLLSDRRAQVEILAEMCADAGLNPLKLLGGSKKADKAIAEERLKERDVRIIFGTYKLLSEGFDHPPISHLLLGTPFKDSIRIEQCIGRVQRVFPMKEQSFIIDFIDDNGILFKQASERAYIYSLLKTPVINYNQVTW
jgi:superfamily II DNA or RNA helicase